MKKTGIGGSIIAGLLAFVPVNSSGFELNGFADVTYTKCVQKDCETVLGDRGGRNGHFTLGELDFFAVSQLDQVDVLLEFTVEEGSEVDLERLTLGYAFSDALRLRVGRFHTPLGYWNTAYHHGVQTQPTIRRPQFLSFEHDNGVLPLHTVGVYASGRFKNQSMGIEYGAMVGNGPRITARDGAVALWPNPVSDDSPGKSAAVHLAVSPSGTPGFSVGGSGHFARVKTDQAALDLGAPPVDVDQTIMAGVLRYERGAWELTGEYFSIRDRDNRSGGSGTHSNHAFYGLVSYAVTPRWVPYLVYENLTVQTGAGEDPYFIKLGASDIAKGIVGVRYHLSHRSSLRGEARRVRWGDYDWTEYAVQWALGF